MRIMRRDDVKDRGYLKLMLVGQPGTKKTRTAASAALDPRCGKVLLISFGGNPISFADYPQWPDIVEMESAADLEQLNVLYTYLSSGQKGTVFGFEGPYGTIILDGTTALNQWFQDRLTGNATKKIGAPHSAVEIQQYGSVLSTMNALAQSFFNLPMHVIMTSLEKRRDDLVVPDYKPESAWGAVCQWAYAVVRLVNRSRVVRADLKGTEYARVEDVTKDATTIAFLQEGGLSYCKWQYGPSPALLVEPTVTDFLNLIQKGQGQTQ